MLAPHSIGHARHGHRYNSDFYAGTYSKRLQRFNFSNNPVRGIPTEVGELPELRELQLADNELVTLPESIGKLRHLRWLGLAGNRFTANEASRIEGWFRSGIVSGLR